LVALFQLPKRELGHTVEPDEMVITIATVRENVLELGPLSLSPP